MSKKYSEYLEINPSFESVVDIDADMLTSIVEGFSR